MVLAEVKSDRVKFTVGDESEELDTQGDAELEADGAAGRGRCARRPPPARAGRWRRRPPRAPRHRTTPNTLAQRRARRREMRRRRGGATGAPAGAKGANACRGCSSGAGRRRLGPDGRCVPQSCAASETPAGNDRIFRAALPGDPSTCRAAQETRRNDDAKITTTTQSRRGVAIAVRPCACSPPARRPRPSPRIRRPPTSATR